MLLKQTLGVNFINVIQADFIHTDPKSAIGIFNRNSLENIKVYKLK